MPQLTDLFRALSLQYSLVLPLIGSILVCLTLARCLYLLRFHPLSKYPGPFLNRVSGIPALFHAWRGDLHYHLYELHQAYGDRVRYSPNKLSIRDVKALNDIYGFNKNVSKPEEFFSAFRINKHAINTFNTSSKEAHRRKRRIMAHGFSEAALKSYENFIILRLEEFVSKLRGGLHYLGATAQKSFDMSYEFNCLMLDIMGGLCFGEAFGFVAGKGDEILSQAHKRTFRIYMTGHEPLLKRLYLDRLLFPQLLRASNILGNYAKLNTSRRIEKHRKGEGVYPDNKGYEDIMAHLLEAGDEETGTKYSDNELLGEGVLMMMAGSDTSSSSLTATLFYLAHHPRALTKLRAELTARYPGGPGTIARGADSCQYLRACMDEAMRLSPPAPTNIPRIVGAGGLDIIGEHVPEGMYVGVPNFALFRDERNFDRPHEYLPERWIAGAEIPGGGAGRTAAAEEVRRASAAFQPFSLGPRHCIGRHLAMREVSLILATVLLEFDVQTEGSSGVLPRKLPGVGKGLTMEQSDVYTSVEHDVRVRLGRRKVAGA